MEEILIIACDSRGCGLHSFINANFKSITDQYDLRIVVLPGATIQRLIKEIECTLKRLSVRVSTIHIIISAGICNFTEKLNHLGGPELAYNRSDAKLSSFAECINNIQGYFSSIIPKHVTLYTQITTIAPVSIKHYRDFQFQKNHLIYSFLAHHLKVSYCDRLLSVVRRQHLLVTTLEATF